MSKTSDIRGHTARYNVVGDATIFPDIVAVVSLNKLL